MSAALTGRTEAAASTVVAAELVAWLSVLLSLRDDPTDELSTLTLEGVWAGGARVEAMPPWAAELSATSSDTVATRPESAYSVCAPDWDALLLPRLSRDLITSTFSASMASSFAELAGSKKWMTPFPDLCARAWAVMAISCASWVVSECKKVKPHWRIELMTE
jgi:hypothetical protein